MSEQVILVVDDERNVLNALVRLLRGPGRRILVAESAAEALLLLGSEEVTAVIADEVMPGMRGLELLARAQDLEPRAKRLLLTGYPDAEVVRTALGSRVAHQVILKPWDDAELRRRLEAELGHDPQPCREE